MIKHGQFNPILKHSNYAISQITWSSNCPFVCFNIYIYTIFRCMFGSLIWILVFSIISHIYNVADIESLFHYLTDLCLELLQKNRAGPYVSYKDAYQHMAEGSFGALSAPCSNVSITCDFARTYLYFGISRRHYITYFMFHWVGAIHKLVMKLFFWHISCTSVGW